MENLLEINKKVEWVKMVINIDEETKKKVLDFMNSPSL